MAFADSNETLITARRPRPFPQNTAEPQGTQQLVARIKRSSKYFHQTPPGEWFDVRLSRRYPVVSGNNNAYEKSDVVFGVRLADGTVFELK